MKKVISTIIIGILIFHLVACDSKKTEEVTIVPLGETVSTDIVDFTLEYSELCYELVEPFKPYDGVDNPGLATGYTFVAMRLGCAFNNIDDYENWKKNWKKNWYCTLNDKEYHINGFDSFDSRGRGNIDFINPRIFVYTELGNGDWKGVSYSEYEFIREGRKKLKPNDTLLININVVGVIGVDPQNLNLPYSITVNLPTSSGKDQLVTYLVNQ